MAEAKYIVIASTSSAFAYKQASRDARRDMVRCTGHLVPDIEVFRIKRFWKTPIADLTQRKAAEDKLLESIRRYPHCTFSAPLSDNTVRLALIHKDRVEGLEIIDGPAFGRYG